MQNLNAETSLIVNFSMIKYIIYCKYIIIKILYFNTI
jgi:hypothetical protein